MTTETNIDRPIGYWLKRADELITQHVDNALREFGVTRFHWQAFNIIHDAEKITKAVLLEPMITFIDRSQLDLILADLESKGWIIYHDNPAEGSTWVELTEDGRVAYERLLRMQIEVRQRVAQGISEEEYLTTIRVLQKMVSNLE